MALIKVAMTHPSVFLLWLYINLAPLTGSAVTPGDFSQLADRIGHKHAVYGSLRPNGGLQNYIEPRIIPTLEKLFCSLCKVFKNLVSLIQRRPY